MRLTVMAFSFWQDYIKWDFARLFRVLYCINRDIFRSVNTKDHLWYFHAFGNLLNLVTLSRISCYLEKYDRTKTKSCTLRFTKESNKCNSLREVWVGQNDDWQEMRPTVWSGRTKLYNLLRQTTQTNIWPFALATFSSDEVVLICFSAEALYTSENQKRECLLFSTDRVGCVSLI